MNFKPCVNCKCRTFWTLKNVILDEIVTVTEDGNLVDSGKGTEAEGKTPEIVYEGFTCTECGDQYLDYNELAQYERGRGESDEG